MTPKDRDVFFPKHRAASQPAIEGTPDEVEEERSQAYEVGEKRDQLRMRRGTDARVLRLEHRVDEQSKQINAIGADVALVKGGVDTLVRLQTAAESRALSAAADKASDKTADRIAAEQAALRRWGFARMFVVKVLVPIALGVGALLGYRAVGG